MHVATPPLDRRLIDAGMSVTVADLVAVFVAHRPGVAAACPACGHRYTTAASLCPSAELARRLLKTRRHEDPNAVAPIVKELDADDHRALPRPERAPAAASGDELFPVDPAWRKPRRPRSRL